jgi:hypothetical protein
MVGFVLDSLGEDGCEGVNSGQLVIGDDLGQWEKGFLDGREVIVGRLPFEGGKLSWASLKRQVIASGVVLAYFGLGAGRGPLMIAMMAMRAIPLAKAI